MSDYNKIISKFLQANNLTETLNAFKNDIRRSQSQIVTNYNLSQLSKLQINFMDKEAQNKIREYLQRTNVRYLRRVIERMKKNLAKQNKQQRNLNQLSIIKKLAKRQQQNYKKYREQFTQNRQMLQQSQINLNEWQNDNDVGFQYKDININSLSSLQSNKQLNLISTPFPTQYYNTNNQTKHLHRLRSDHMPSKLPPQVKFQPSRNKEYPLDYNNITYDSYGLKIIYDREKTGFEQDKDIKIVINQVLGGKYQIISVLGKAQFSTAVQVRDLISKKSYCLKIIQNNKQFIDQSLDEIKLLRYIKANCNPDQFNILHLYDFFYHKQHLFLCTELLGDNLLDAYKHYGSNYFTLKTIQLISKQILIGLSKLHQLHIVHSDLKPQNILLKSKQLKTIKIIDFGNSVFKHDPAFFYVQTRIYRAPEVILGCPYDEKIDIWSFGCIIAELFSGQVLFDSNNKPQQLARMQAIRGPWPSWMIKHGKYAKDYFTEGMLIYEKLQDEEQSRDSSYQPGSIRVYLPKTTNLKSRMKCNDTNFIDFLSKCLKLDPSKRYSAKEALKHPFIANTIQE